MHHLAVVSDVFIDLDSLQTVNRSLNEILCSYARHFDEVHFIAPARAEISRVEALAPNIVFSTFSEYGKPLRKRIAYYLQNRRVQARFRALFSTGPANLIQLRMPSFFSMAAYRPARKLGLPITTYVAGDWSSGFAANYPFSGANIVGCLLEWSQRPIIRNSVCVTAGPVIAGRYRALTECHAYFSTTHNRVVYKKLEGPPSRLLFVGRLEPLKRLEDAIEAVRLLRLQNDDISLTVVGEGRWENNLRQFAEARGLQDAVIFRGKISDPVELSSIYGDADILVLPSLSEGTPKVLAEAMAHGVIPIAVRGVGSNAEIIKHCIRGFLVSPKAPAEIADVVDGIRADLSLRSKHVQAGYVYAEAHTLDFEVDKLWSFVQTKFAR